MTSSSSLYGTVTTQNSSSSNSTSLYGEAGTPIPDSSGNVVVRGDLYVLSGNILTTASTGNVFPTNATTVNLGLAATAVNIGAGTGTTTVNNDLDVAGDLTISGTFVAPSADFGKITIAVADDQTITTTAGELRVGSATGIVKLPSVTAIYTDNTSTFNLLNQPTVVNAFRAATTLNIGADTGETNINNDLLVEGTGTFTGDITAPGADLGAITIGIADDQTITTQSGELRVSSFNGAVKLAAIDSLYTDTTGTFNLLNQPTTVFAFRNATALEIGEDTGTTGINNNLRIDGTTVSVAQATSVLYSENNNRLNRPSVRSTSGNTSGWRVEAPNATTSAIANISAFSSNDNDNGKFISIQARGAATNDLRIQTGKYTAGVLGATGSVVSFIDNVTPYATVNPAGPTNPLDLTTKAYVDGLTPTLPSYTTNVVPAAGGVELDLQEIIGAGISIVGSTKFLGGTNITVSETAPNEITIDGTDLNTTYTIDASATTGGANLNLVGSDSTTDTVKIASGTGVTVSQTSANELSVAIGQAVGTTDDVQFDNVTANSVTTGTVNANGGVSFINTAPMGGTYATVNQFGPAVGTDLTTVDYVNSVLPTVVTYTQDASATTGGANLNLVGSDSTTDTVKFSGGGATTVAQTSANEITISTTDTNTTYTIDASSTTGGANLNLVGSDATTDTVKIADGAGITVTQTDANTVTVASTITQYTDAQARASISATGDISYNSTTGVISYTTPADAVTSVNGQTGAVSLGIADLDDATVTAVVNKDFLQYNTTTSKWENGPIQDASKLAGSLEATQDPNFVFPPPTITAVSSNNGFDIASTSALYAGPNGAGPQASVTNYTNDTWAGANASAQFNLKGANGYSSTSGVDPLTGVTMAGPTAANTSMALGAINFAGYATTGFANDICATNQSGGLSTLNTLQIQAIPRETFADAVTTITPTAVSRSAPAVTGLTITGTKGQFSCTSTTLGLGQVVRITGTWTGTGSIVGYTGDNSYYIVKTNNTTTFTLSATPNGGPITTTAGTTTGTTVTRNIVLFTIPAQATAPYGSGARITVSGITGLADGQYIATSTTTQVIVGAVTTAVSLGGTPLLSIRNVTNSGTTFRVRGFNSATNMTIANRTNFISHDLGTATYKSDQFNLQGGTNTFNYLGLNAAGGTFACGPVTFKNLGATANITGNNIIYNRVYAQFENNTTITPAAINTAAVFPLGTATFSNIATVGSTSRLIIGAPGIYNLQFSVQVSNADSQEHTAYIWLRKNGVDLANSTGRITIVRLGSTITGWNFMVDSANTTDYYEIAYAVDDTNITFPTFGSTAFCPGTAALVTTLTPVGA